MRRANSIAVLASVFLLGATPPVVVGVERTEPAFEVRAPATPVIPNVGARLASRIRRDGLDREQSILARGLTREAILTQGGVVTAELGPIIAARLSGRAIQTLAPDSVMIEAPQRLRPALDLSRLAIHADATDEGRDLPEKFRGKDTLIGIYDTGIDLLHPDLRDLEGKTRVVALWDQTTSIQCDKEELAMNTCNSNDAIGHGTHVASIAAGNSPSYRGIAPEAGLVIARSETFERFVETLAYFQEVAGREKLPLVVNVSLAGHEGPHDGTSLESQAIDASPHLVVTAAGNDGASPVHAFADLNENKKQVALRFPVLPGGGEQHAIVEIWSDGQPSASALVLSTGGTVLASTGTISAGDPGRTATLVQGTTTFGTVSLDAEAAPNPFNGRTRIRLEVTLRNWQDAPAGPGVFAVAIEGIGATDLWVESPPEQLAPVSFDAEGILDTEDALLGDTDRSVSDPATAVSAVAVTAFTTRLEFPGESGNTGRVGGVVGAIPSFSSRGPTLAPERTGAKPDLAAPGYVIVAARGRAVGEDENGLVSPLYRAAAGTSMAAPHVSGTVALILDAQPAASKADLKAILLQSAQKDDESMKDSADARWGAGMLDAKEAVSLALGLSDGCGCTASRGENAADAQASVLLLLACGLARRWARLRGGYPRVT